jgi:8-oxo-dGTP pyrophosphatase MutT (NUDIX family)
MPPKSAKSKNMTQAAAQAPEQSPVQRNTELASEMADVPKPKTARKSKTAAPAPELPTSNVSSTPAAVIAAAARETFEECGVLIARGQDGQPAAFDESLQSDRVDLVNDTVTFAEVLDRRGLRVDDGELASLAHWVTPENEPRRFDARFFVAALPQGQHTYDVDGEADRTAWLRPVDALQAWHDGTLDMWIPTASTMRLLTEGETAAEVIENARRRSVVPVRPHEVPGPDGNVAWYLVHDRSLEVLEPMDPKDMESETAVARRT